MDGKVKSLDTIHIGERYFPSAYRFLLLSFYTLVQLKAEIFAILFFFKYFIGALKADPSHLLYLKLTD